MNEPQRLLLCQAGCAGITAMLVTMQCGWKLGLAAFFALACLKAYDRHP